jgi:hypothetical protein
METLKYWNLKLFALYFDNEEWRNRFLRICFSPYRRSILSHYKTNRKIPSKRLLVSFIEEDFRHMEKDNRDTKEILLDLLSLVWESGKKKTE